MLGLDDRSPCPEPSRVDICFWPKFKRDDGWYVEPDLQKDDLGDIQVLKEAPWLWAWKENKVWSKRSWFLVVSLSGIRSREDIGTHIVGPVTDLLDDKSPCDAFRGTCVIRHAKD